MRKEEGRGKRQEVRGKRGGLLLVSMLLFGIQGVKREGERAITVFSPFAY